MPAAGITLKLANVTITNINPEEPSTKPNQDAFLVDTCLNGDRNTHLFGVFDGHGPAGHHCAQVSLDNLLLCWAGAPILVNSLLFHLILLDST